MSYHDLFITTEKIPRTSIFNLPFNLEVACCRSAGWQLWQHQSELGKRDATCIAGEYEGKDKWLVLDVAGHVVLDSRKTADDDDDDDHAHDAQVAEAEEGT